MWSDLQNDIFKFIEGKNGNLVIEAVAGSGKTTTIVEAVKRTQSSSVLFLAFNKAIAEELKSRGVNARTFHSLTFGPVMKSRGQNNVTQHKVRDLVDQVFAHRLAVKFAKERGVDVMDDVVQFDAAFAARQLVKDYGGFVSKLVGYAKNEGIGCVTEDTFEAWQGLVDHHELEPEAEDADIRYGIELAWYVLQANNRSQLVDFDDMLYFAVKDNLKLPNFAWVFCDEAQDLNAIQRAILRKVMLPKTRLVAVGDGCQAIYGFRGASVGALGLLAHQFACTRMPLSVTYRCPVAVVELAQQYVPEITAAPGALQGLVEYHNNVPAAAWFQPGDLVMCRKTAPIIKQAYRFLRERKPMYVMGRDIGAGLIGLVKKLNAKDIEQLDAKLNKYQAREEAKLQGPKDEAKLQALQDKCESLRALLDGCGTVQEVINVINSMFEEKDNAVVLCTIHKAKGLEADRCVWLEKEGVIKMDMQGWREQEELNLRYVAVTRAKKELHII